MTKVLAFIILLTLCSCSSNSSIYHGYTFNDIDKIDQKINNYKNNKTTRQVIEKDLGSPTFTEKTNEKLTYFYVEDAFKKSPIVGESKLYSKILKIDFNLNNTFQSAEFYKIEGKGYFNNSDKTEVKGNKMGFFEQMHRNLTTIGKTSES
jgi:outer membrane protein assembly factor BamE (lipoprotein component of BamABCDE complex)